MLEVTTEDKKSYSAQFLI